MPHRAVSESTLPATHQVAATVALQHAPRKHPFLEAAHHPFIAGISHICSPLSAALLVFGIHKWWQRGAMNAWWEARRTMNMSIVHSTNPSIPAPNIITAAKTLGKTDTSCVRQFCTQAKFRPRFLLPCVSTSALIDRGSAASSIHCTQVRLFRPSISFAAGHAPTLSRSATSSSSVWCASTSPFGRFSLVNFINRRMHTSSMINTTRENRWRATAAAAAVPAVPVSIATNSPSTLVTSASGDSTAVVAVLPTPTPTPTPPSVPTLADIYGAEDVPLVLDHLSHWWSVVLMQDLITWLHISTDLPWWSSIAAATVLLRLVAMPFEVVMLRNSLRMKQILPEVEQLQADMKNAITVEKKQQYAQELLQLFKEKRCSPMHGLYIPFLFPPMFLSLFGATHNLALAEPSLTTGGALWFVDLVLPDPTWMLPVAASLTWLSLLEMTAGSFYLANSKFRSFSQTLAVAFIPVVANMPAGVFCFWITSNLFSMLRVAVLNRDAVRRLLNIPLRSEISALAHVPRSIGELLTPVELRTLVNHAKQLAKPPIQGDICQRTTRNT